MSLSYGAVQKYKYTAPPDDQEQHVYASLNDSHLDNASKRWRGILLKIAGTISFVMVLAGLAVMASVQHNLKSIAPIAVFLDTDITLLVASVSNEYGVWNSDSMFPYPFLENSLFVEPYKETTVVLADPYDGCSYDWTITKTKDGLVDSLGMSADGSIILSLTTVGEYILAVDESCGDVSTSARSLSKTVWVKYVRRELSTLNSKDRTAFLDAFHTLWTVSTTAGQAKYGDRYKSVNYFATLHNDGGGNNVCDEFHGGYGFMNNHLYLSSYLEQSLQLVDPSVALHYMEYGKYFESSGYTERK